MKKATIAAIAMALVVAACSSDDAGETTTTEAPATTTTEAPATTTSVAPETTTTTEAPSIPTTPYVPGEDADADELHDLYAVVFDSSTSYEDKAPLIDDPEGLEGTVAAYATAGDQVGGITLEVTATGVEGDAAAVMYDLQFAGNPFQMDQEGTAVRIDGTWKVTRDYFCEIMRLARVTSCG